MPHEELKYEVFDWMRFPLIVFVVYIHSFGKPMDFSAIDFNHLVPVDYYNLFRLSISHVLTHIAVPLFFFISGYLFFVKLQSWKSKIYRDKIRKRVKTLLIPFLIWNTIAILLKVLRIVRHDGFDTLGTYIGNVNIFSLYWDYHVWDLDRLDWLGLPTPSTSPYLFPLWYLRDLMVVMILSPVIYYLFKYTKQFGLVILFICYLSLIGFKIPGFSTTALFFFGAGAFFNLHHIDPMRFTLKYRPIIYILAIMLWIAVTRYGGPHTYIGNILYPFYVTIGSLAMFNLATTCVKNGWVFPERLTQSTFFIYLSHTIMIPTLSRSVTSGIFGDKDPLSLSISYFLSPLLSVAICVIIYCLLKRCLPKTCAVLTGER